jgi:hypothetical protein
MVNIEDTNPGQAELVPAQRVCLLTSAPALSSACP